MLPENLNRHWEKAMIFDLVDELIFIFVSNIPGAPDNLIAAHISNFISKRRDHLAKDIIPPDQDAIRKRVGKFKKKLTNTPTI